MAKITAYAKSNPAAKMLLQNESELPKGHTLLVPPAAEEGFVVTWDYENDAWYQKEIPIPEDDIEGGQQ